MSEKQQTGSVGHHGDEELVFVNTRVGKDPTATEHYEGYDYDTRSLEVTNNADDRENLYDEEFKSRESDGEREMNSVASVDSEHLSGEYVTRDEGRFADDPELTIEQRHDIHSKDRTYATGKEDENEDRKRCSDSYGQYQGNSIDAIKGILSRYTDKNSDTKRQQSNDTLPLDTIESSGRNNDFVIENFRPPSINLMNFLPSDEASDPFLHVIEEADEETDSMFEQDQKDGDEAIDDRSIEDKSQTTTFEVQDADDASVLIDEKEEDAIAANESVIESSQAVADEDAVGGGVATESVSEHGALFESFKTDLADDHHLDDSILYQNQQEEEDAIAANETIIESSQAVADEDAVGGGVATASASEHGALFESFKTDLADDHHLDDSILYQKQVEKEDAIAANETIIESSVATEPAPERDALLDSYKTEVGDNDYLIGAIVHKEEEEEDSNNELIMEVRRPSFELSPIVRSSSANDVLSSDQDEQHCSTLCLDNLETSNNMGFSAGLHIPGETFSIQEECEDNNTDPVESGIRDNSHFDTSKAPARLDVSTVSLYDENFHELLKAKIAADVDINDENIHGEEIKFDNAHAEHNLNDQAKVDGMVDDRDHLDNEKFNDDFIESIKADISANAHLNDEGLSNDKEIHDTNRGSTQDVHVSYKEQVPRENARATVKSDLAFERTPKVNNLKGFGVIRSIFSRRFRRGYYAGGNDSELTRNDVYNGQHDRITDAVCNGEGDRVTDDAATNDFTATLSSNGKRPKEVDDENFSPNEDPCSSTTVSGDPVISSSKILIEEDFSSLVENENKNNDASEKKCNKSVSRSHVAVKDNLGFSVNMDNMSFDHKIENDDEHLLYEEHGKHQSLSKSPVMPSSSSISTISTASHGKNSLEFELLSHNLLKSEITYQDKTQFMDKDTHHTTFSNSTPRNGPNLTTSKKIQRASTVPRSSIPTKSDDQSIYKRLYSLARDNNSSFVSSRGATDEQKLDSTRTIFRSASSPRSRSESVGNIRESYNSAHLTEKKRNAELKKKIFFEKIAAPKVERKRATGLLSTQERLYNLAKEKREIEEQRQKLKKKELEEKQKPRGLVLESKRATGLLSTQERLYNLAKKKREIEEQRQKLKKKELEEKHKSRGLVLESKRSFTPRKSRGDNVHLRLYSLANIKRDRDDKPRQMHEVNKNNNVRSLEQCNASVNRLYSRSLKMQEEGFERRRRIEMKKEKSNIPAEKISVERAADIYERGMMKKIALEMKREEEGIVPYVSPLLNPLIAVDDYEDDIYSQPNMGSVRGRSSSTVKSRSRSSVRSVSRARSTSNVRDRSSRPPSRIAKADSFSSIPMSPSSNAKGEPKRVRSRSRLRSTTPTTFSFRSPSPTYDSSRFPTNRTSSALPRSRYATPQRAAQRHSTKQLLRQMEEDVDFYKKVKKALVTKEDKDDGFVSESSGSRSTNPFQTNKLPSFPPLPRPKTHAADSGVTNGDKFDSQSSNRTCQTGILTMTSNDSSKYEEEGSVPTERFLVRPRSLDYCE